MKILGKKIVLVLTLIVFAYGSYYFIKNTEQKNESDIENVLNNENYINLSTMTYDNQNNMMEKKFFVIWKEDYTDENKIAILKSKISFNFELKKSQLKNSDFIILKNKEGYSELQLKLFETGLFKTVERDNIVKPMQLN